MVAFVFLMVTLMSKNIDEKQDLNEQSTRIDENSVIYSDVGTEDMNIENEQDQSTESETSQMKN